MELNLQALSDFLAIAIFTYEDRTFTLGQLLLLPSVIVVGLLLMRWLGSFIVKRMRNRDVNPDVVHLVQRVFYVVAITVLVITSLDLLNVPLTAFAFVSGAVAIGVGFGAQNIINNFISGWILMWEKPIKIGDFLEVGESRGKVESINTRSTRIRRVDGVHMLVPNSHLLENIVVNWTLIDRLTRTQVRVGVEYGSPVKRVAELVLEAVRAQEEVLTDPEPRVIFEDFGDSALIFDAYFWVNAEADRDLRVTRSNIRFSIEELLRNDGIVIAFPQRDVHIDGAISINRD